jgi:hypothetical protein
VEVTDVRHPGADDVALHLEGQLAPADEQRVAAHLRECADCAALAGDLAALPEALRTAADPPPPMPEQVAHRIQAALAREAGVASLDERRTRRRRVLGAGLLAAAAATVVAVGLGELVQNTGSGGSASSGAQQESAVAGRRPTRPLHERQDAAALGADGTRPRQQQGDLGVAGASLRARSALAGLVEGVAAAHTPERARYDRDACVRTALGLTGGGAVGSLASYAVELPGRGVPGAVVLRPSRAPAEGLVVSCGPRPQVLLRHGLDR